MTKYARRPIENAKLRVLIFPLMFFLLFAAGCKKSSEESRILDNPENILAGFDLLAKFQETSEIDLNDPEAYQHLRTGWGKRGKQFVQSQGLKSLVVFYTFDTSTDKEMVFSCVPAAWTPARKISISLNGALVADIELGDALKKYAVVLPASHLQTGQNLVVFSFSDKISPSDAISKDLSIGFEKIAFKGGSFVRKTYWAPKKLGRLIQFAGSSFVYSVKGENPVQLRAEFKLKNKAKGNIKIQTEGRETQIYTLSPHDQKAVIDITGQQGSPVKIEFMASGPKKGKLLWKNIGLFPLDHSTVISGEIDSDIKVSDYNRQEKPDIIIYVIDTLRSDHLGCYGYERNASPNMDAFAKENTLFVNAFANSSWTRSSGATLQTGLRVKNHKTMTRDSKLSDKLVTLAEILKENGYYTAAFNTNGNVGRKFGFDQGFDTFVVLAEDKNRESIHIRSNVINKKITKFLRTYLAKENRQPLFLWIWSTDPHDPYTPHESVSGYFDIDQYEPIDNQYRLLGEFTTRVQKSHFTWPSQSELEYMIALYDQEILYNDISFGKLLNKLTRMGLYEDSLIILTADHGEEFQDHGWYGHGKTLFNEQVKIPFIIKADEIKKGVQNAQVQHTDIYPTICDILDIPLPYELDGDSLLSSIDFDSRPIYAEEALDGHYLRSLVLGPNKFIYNLPEGKYLHLNWRSVLPYEMFNIQNDPNEKYNIIDLSDPVCAYMRQRLSAEFASPFSRLGIQYQKTEIPPKLEETLRALGYLK